MLRQLRETMLKSTQVLMYLLWLSCAVVSASAHASFSSLEAPEQDEGVWLIQVAQEQDSAAYFNAFQSSQPMLYRTLGWGWPTAKLTLESNVDTMRFYEQQHANNRAYTYVIRDGQRRIRGALFVNPVQSRPGLMGFDASQFEVEVTFWLNQQGQDSSAANELVPQIADWLRDDWGVRSALFPAARSNRFARQQYEGAGFDFVAEDSNNNEILYRFRAR